MGETQPAGGHALVTAEVTARRFGMASPVITLLGVLVLVLFGLMVALAIASRTGAGLAPVTFPVALLGLVIALRQPGNRIAWLLLGFSAVFAIDGIAAGYSVWDYHFHGGSLPFGPAAVVIASELWSAIFLLLPLVILLFPDGRLPSRWRMVMRAYLAVCALIAGILLASGASQVSGTPIVVTSKGQLVNNPGATGTLAIPLVILVITVPVFWALFVTRQVLSWRQATGERRAQLKWLMTGGVITVIGLAGTFLFAQFSGPPVTVLDGVMLAFGVFSLPAGLSIGILKYHLYDIDRIISRTLAYAIVTGLLIGVYAGVVLLATRVLPFRTPVAVAAATLAAAALFNPVRRRVQKAVDRRFNRARYDADTTITAFAAHLRDEVNLDAVSADLLGVVRAALEPTHVSVWISHHGGPNNKVLLQ